MPGGVSLQAEIGAETNASAGRKQVGDDDAACVRRPVVGDDERVGRPAARGDGIGHVGLGDRDVGTRGACTVVVAVAVLLPAFVSGSVRLDGRGVGERRCPTSQSQRTAPVIVERDAAPGASVPSAHVSVVVPVHGGVALTNVTSAGNVSVTVTFVAVDGPLFVAFRL